MEQTKKKKIIEIVVTAVISILTTVFGMSFTI